MPIRPLKSGHERGKYKPVQAYIDKGVLYRFNKLYPSHGDITKLIRNAFVIAIKENEASIEGSKQAVKTLLPNAPATETITLPCEVCLYPEICVADQQCVLREELRRDGWHPTVTENGVERPVNKHDTVDFDSQGLDKQAERC